MPAKSATFDNDLLKLIFQATPTITGLLDNAGTSPVTVLSLALHTADPSSFAGAGTVGTQNASEAAYTGYARATVARSGVGFTVTGASVSPAADVSFPAGTGGTGTATYFSIGTSAATGTATLMLYYGPLTPNIVMGNGITPVIKAASTVTEA